MKTTVELDASSRIVLSRELEAFTLHVTFARRKKATQIVTRNPSHFQHVAPYVEILTP